jgi:NAD(P)-dependent dehydrogenase (short-subunit alcohol dehydrogenase family)
MRTTDTKIIDFKKKFDLETKSIIITGACGLIGKAFTEACLQFGANVIMADINKTEPEKTANEFNNRYPEKCFGFSVDVSQRKEVENLLAYSIKKFKYVDGLVNTHQNKTASFFAKFEEYDDKNWDAVIETNLKGTFLSCQIIGENMLNNGGGSIVNMPSTYSVVAPNQNLYKGTNLGCPAAYAASKGGVMALSQYLATYWADKNIRVNQITPHGVWNYHEEQFEKNFASFSPMQRMSYNHEVAGALIFLLSNASSYVTGHNILVDGGWTTW